MIEGLKELVGLLKDIPEMGLWILGGFLFYKLFFMGSIVGAIVKIVTLAINKYHELEMKPEEKVYKFPSGITMMDDAKHELDTLLDTVIRRENIPQKDAHFAGHDYKTFYIHKRHIDKLSAAYLNATKENES